MSAIVQTVGHIVITLVAVVGLALRVEHRLTKIETDMSWLKKKVNGLCIGESDHGKDSTVDPA